MPEPPRGVCLDSRQLARWKYFGSQEISDLAGSQQQVAEVHYTLRDKRLRLLLALVHWVRQQGVEPLEDVKSGVGELLRDFAMSLPDGVVSFGNLARPELAFSEDRNIMQQKANATTDPPVTSPDCLVFRYLSR